MRFPDAPLVGSRSSPSRGACQTIAWAATAKEEQTVAPLDERSETTEHIAKKWP